MSSETRKESMLDRLPYYWVGENATKVIEIIATLLADVEVALAAIRTSRDLDQATGISLDYIGRNVGTRRRLLEHADGTETEEGDETFREWIKWNIFLQESSGLIDQLKHILAWWLAAYNEITGLGGKVREPLGTLDYERANCEDVKGYNFSVTSEDLAQEGELRDVTEEDIQIFEHSIPLYGLKAGAGGTYGGLWAMINLSMPWESYPFKAFQRPFRISQTSGQVTSNSLWGIGYGIIKGEPEQLDLTPLQEILDLARAAGVQTELIGHGGFRLSQTSGQTGSSTVHGIGYGRITGDVKRWIAHHTL
jgi:hypothetical protein